MNSVVGIYIVYFIATLFLSGEQFSGVNSRIDINSTVSLWNVVTPSSSILKSIVFLCVAAFILFRSKAALHALGIYNEIYPLLVAIGSGLLVTFSPIHSAYYTVLAFFIVHIRFLYIIILLVSRVFMLMVLAFPFITCLYIGYVVVTASYARYGISFASLVTIVYISIVLGLAKAVSEEVDSVSNSIEIYGNSIAKRLLHLNDSMTIYALRFGISIGGTQNELKEVASKL